MSKNIHDKLPPKTTSLPAELDTLENAPEAFLRNYARPIKRWQASEFRLIPYFELWCEKYGPELERRRHERREVPHESTRSA